ncbi:MAG: GTP-binding protein [Myxococcota bacterium]|jgi:GTP-binding protein
MSEVRNIGRVEFLGSFPKNPPLTGLPEVAFAGRSNVGKSSAINTLLNRKKAARVSGTPGRTQLINLFRIDDRLCFADLPGYGYAKVPEPVREKWKKMIETYLSEREDLKLVAILVDSSISVRQPDADLIEALQEAGLPVMVVATKIDRLGPSRRKAKLAKLAEGLGVPVKDVLPFSSTKRMGINVVWRRIDSVVKK